MSHAVEIQLTYVKEFVTTNRINADAISKIFTIIRDNIIQFSDQYQQVTRDILCLNIMLHGQKGCIFLLRR
jgi:hypothetical protein